MIGITLSDTLRSGPVETGHATFDRWANHPTQGHVGPGNVVSAVQVSSHIRAFAETESGGMDFEAGRLWRFDLAPFRRTVEARIWREIEALTRESGGILYHFSNPNGRTRTVHGMILTATDRTFVSGWLTGPTAKSRDVLIDMAARVSIAPTHQKEAA